MKRIDVIRQVAACSGIIVANIGFPSRELFSIVDRSEHFYMLGSMGLASSIGLGLALCRPEPVYVIDGDGSLLMNLGSLATIARECPKNLCLVVVDNGTYGSTGNQPTATASGADLASVARAAGCERVTSVSAEAELQSALASWKSGCAVIVVKTEPGNAQVPVIPLTPEEIRERFIQRLKTVARCS